jgi:hypothetical protein
VHRLLKINDTRWTSFFKSLERVIGKYKYILDTLQVIYKQEKNFTTIGLFQFLTHFDSIKNITPLWRPGFQVGILGNLRLSSFVDLRVIPLFVIREKALRFDYLNDSTLNHSVESVLFNLPVEFKFKSDRQTNFRFYVLAGGKLDYDFNANARSKRPDEIIKFKPVDFGYNLGLGFEFYYPNFIFSPEIKISNGLGNVLLRNTNEPTNKALDKLSTRMIYISFLIQG